MFTGIFTALATPLKGSGVDLAALHQLVDRQIQAGIQGLVVCASTGEGLSLSADERKLIIDSTVKRVQGRIQVIAGCSATATRDAVEGTRMAQDLGADGILVSAPPYVRPSQDGLYAHFSEIASGADLPVILYNVPARTACDLLPSTVALLAGHDNIVAIKEASGSLERIQQIISSVAGRLVVLSGDDPLTLSTLVAGGKGVISTGANVVPEKWASLWQYWLQGDIMSAAAVQAGLLGLHGALFSESNPGPCKAALYLLGFCEPEIRLPLMWPSRPAIYRIAAELERLGIQIHTESLV